MGRHRRVERTSPLASELRSRPDGPEADPGAEAGVESRAGHRHRAAHRKRSTMPLRTGLYGASAAVAVGAVAMASGLLPGPGGPPGGDRSARVRADGPGTTPTQGAPSSLPSSSGRSSDGASRGDAQRGDGPTDDASGHASQGRDQQPGQGHGRGHGRTQGSGGDADGRSQDTGSPGRGGDSKPDGAGNAKSTPPRGSTDSAPPSAQADAERQVLTLVNQERGKVGCKPVTADHQLDGLARNFSEEMASDDFFGHTTPGGDTPWDRAHRAGITGLGGENIARGQTDARAVMDTWMHSPGHKANILNCQYHTLGVGVHFGPGGPWWTQDFGF